MIRHWSMLFTTILGGRQCFSSANKAVPELTSLYISKSSIVTDYRHARQLRPPMDILWAQINILQI